jgi:adenosylcobinamide kinase / adenosylcobinamide-phosphate guanylyltransferase
MSLTFLIGGARSGKSSMAVELAAAWKAPVVVVATAEARDAEMEARIDRHRKQRPPDWETIEEPVDLEGVVHRIRPESCILLDCLTLWTSNLMERGTLDPEIERRACRAAELIAARPAPAVAISNEVGSGIVPVSALGRRFQDVLGRVNQIWAEAADSAALVVAGRVLPLSRREVVGRGEP